MKFIWWIKKGYILAASEPEMAGLPIRTRMPEEDLEQKAQIEFERDGISKIGNIERSFRNKNSCDFG